MKYKFPENFLWGSATASHQVEGSNVNDWSIWEKKNAERLAKSAKKKFGYLPNWESIKKEAENPENYISGVACDHYNRYEEDFDIAKSLNQNAFRFSIEWSRIEPEEGRFDEKEIEHYRKVIKALRARGIEPFVTLWHWTSPLWIGDIGGWKNKRTADYFTRYVERVVTSFGDDIKFWITVNEPNIYTAFSYVTGAQPPGEKNIFKAPIVYKNLMKAHRKSYEIIHKYDKDAQVGFSSSMMYFEAKNNFFINRIIKNFADYIWNFLFFEKNIKYNDFIGLNYYTRNLVGVGPLKVKEREKSDLNWEVYPEGISKIRDFAKYGKPIYITENGIADTNDEKRIEYIKGHLISVSKLIEEGVDIRGYLHWSLLDNFEFPEVRGFWPRFGLVEIDYKTLERKIRPSAYEYAKICKENEIEI